MKGIALVGALCVLAAAVLPCCEGKVKDIERVKEWYDHGSLSRVQKAAEHDARGESAGQGEQTRDRAQLCTCGGIAAERIGGSVVARAGGRSPGGFCVRVRAVWSARAGESESRVKSAARRWRRRAACRPLLVAVGAARARST